MLTKSTKRQRILASLLRSLNDTQHVKAIKEDLLLRQYSH